MRMRCGQGVVVVACEGGWVRTGWVKTGWVKTRDGQGGVVMLSSHMRMGKDEAWASSSCHCHRM